MTGDPCPAALAVIIPTLNEAARIGATVRALAPPASALPIPVELIVADGGSTDATVEIAAAAGARVVTSGRGRGVQLAAGAAAATAPWLLFLHADTRLECPTGPAAIAAFLADPANRDRAGYFRFRLDDDRPAARRVEAWVARRCRWLALPYGDQGLLIARALYRSLGGYRPWPLMEDVDMVRRLGRRRLVALAADAITSAVRYRREGYVRRGLRNLCCCALFFLGVPPARLVALYRGPAGRGGTAERG